MGTKKRENSFCVRDHKNTCKLLNAASIEMRWPCFIQIDKAKRLKSLISLHKTTFSILIQVDYKGTNSWRKNYRHNQPPMENRISSICMKSLGNESVEFEWANHRCYIGSITYVIANWLNMNVIMSSQSDRWKHLILSYTYMWK